MNLNQEHLPTIFQLKMPEDFSNSKMKGNMECRLFITLYIYIVNRLTHSFFAREEPFDARLAA